MGKLLCTHRIHSEFRLSGPMMDQMVDDVSGRDDGQGDEAARVLFCYHHAVDMFLLE